ncbi:DUF2380 domain-containing protein [Bradyrhizobium sp. WSM 1738]|uniref:DUF2380 domain-containing protein n=1 Tax=Bradyrhizobium hereditatis TaxID=2821405 RepID=UPI001CE2CBE7|nr:DUF2380 domain-containing protein [Bradyrhizobium hereditatis]MCA6115926.1 DUF2380 domain-containing protein [Bradyrhizobium hereditatis]
MKLRVFGLVLTAAAVVCMWPVRQGHAQGGPPVIAVAGIEYVDTSGEVIDQRADHERRLREFEASLRTDLAASGKIRSVVLDCPPDACSVGDINVAQLAGKAQAAGAGFLVIGSVHKMSTLVQWAKFSIVDVTSQKVVYDRLFSFRGGNDEAWRRAESFVVREIIEREAMLTRSAAAALPRSP